MIRMIPREHLTGMEFREIKDCLFAKNKGDGVVIYRDYRSGSGVSYAYRFDKKIPISTFKELRSIEKIDRIIRNRELAESKQTLIAYC